MPTAFVFSIPALSLPNQYLRIFQDTVVYILPCGNSDCFIFTLHHVVTGLFLLTSLHTQKGGHAVSLGLFIGELTNPMFHIFNILNECRAWKQQAEVVYRWWAPCFACFFTAVRTIFGVPMSIYWSWKVSGLDVPLLHRCVWIVSCLGITAVSQIFACNFVKHAAELMGKKQPTMRKLQAAKGQAPLRVYDSAEDMAYLTR